MNNYNQLKALFAITKASLISTFRNPSTIAFSIIFPIIFILVFGFIGGGGTKLDIAYANNSDNENPIYQALNSIESLKKIEFKDEVSLEKELKKGNLAGVINIQKVQDATQGLPKYSVKVTTSEASPQNGALLLSIVNGIVDKTNIGLSGIQNPPITLQTEQVSGRKYKTIDFILPGQLGFSLLNIGIFGTAFVFFGLRETLVLKRFFATPVSKRNILLGETLSRLIFSLMQAVIIIGIGALFLGFTLVNGISTLLTMLVLSIIGLLIFMGFGFIISGIAKTSDGIPPLANIFTLPQFLLAGTFFSIENFPSWLQPISKILPLTYLNDAMRKVAFEGASLVAVRNEIFVLILWGVVTYIAAVRFFKWDK